MKIRDKEKTRMAIVDYRAAIISREHFACKHKINIPLYLLDYTNEWELTVEEIFATEGLFPAMDAISDKIYGDEKYNDGYYNYWDRDSFDKIESIIKEEFTIQDKPWADCLRFYGFEKGMRLDFWDEIKSNKYEDLSLDMRIKVNKVDYGFLKRIIAIFASFDMLIVIEDTGKIISADYDTFLNIFHSSSRYKRFSGN